MIKVFFLIFEPSVVWDKIAQARRGFVYIIALNLLPFIAICTALETWGLFHHGKWQSHFHRFSSFSHQDIYAFAITEFLLLSAMVFLTALLVFKISQTFQDRLTFLQVFTTIAYAFSPMFLVRFLDYFATMHPGVTWLLGVALMFWTLYQGIPRVMQPDPTHAFGVYLSTTFVVVLTSGLARLMTAMYMLGYIDLQHSWLSHKIIRLLGH